MITYVVHSVVETTAMMPVVFKGITIQAPVPALIVELLEADHGHTFKFTPADPAEMGALLALFTVGAAIDVSFAAHV